MSNNIALAHDHESNKVAQELSLVKLSCLALVRGIQMGFNCAEVVYFIDANTFEDCIEITWGDQKVMRLPRFRTPQSYSMSYSEEDPCIREGRVHLLMPRSALSLSCDALDQQFTAVLLELAQDSCIHPRDDRQEIA